MSTESEGQLPRKPETLPPAAEEQRVLPWYRQLVDFLFAPWIPEDVATPDDWRHDVHDLCDFENTQVRVSECSTDKCESQYLRSSRRIQASIGRPPYSMGRVHDRE